MLRKICETNLPGTGEKPGPTTKGRSAKGLDFAWGARKASLGREKLLVAGAEAETSAYAGALNVKIKEGTIIGMFLPWVVELD